jgi:predicted xylose isomerase-like sugar epimerase
MGKFEELVEQEKLTLEEFEQLEEMAQVKEVEDNGMSGRYYGWHWYTVKTNDGEFDVYVK